MSDASPWVIDISAVARDYMDVEVRYRLACRIPYVKPDVVARWTKPGIQNSFDLGDQFHDVGLFLAGCIPPS